MKPIFRRSEEAVDARRPEHAEEPPDDSQLAGRLEIYSAAPLIQDLHGEAEDEAPVAPVAAEATVVQEAPTEISPPQPPPASRIDVGARVAEVLHAAETAAGQIVGDAEAEAERLRAGAAQELERARAEADQLRRDADAYAETTRTRAEEEAATLRRDVHEELEALRSAAEAEAQALREDGELIRDRLAREGLARQQQLAESTRSLEEQLGAALGAVRGIATELDEVLAHEHAARGDEQSLVETLSNNRQPRRRRAS